MKPNSIFLLTILPAWYFKTKSMNWQRMTRKNSIEGRATMGSSLARQVRAARRRARKRGLRANLSCEAWLITLQDFGYRCAYCGGPGSTIDHVRSLAQGGGTCIDNCVPSCIFCNQRKGSMPLDWLTHVSAERIAQIQHYLQLRQRGKRRPEALTMMPYELPHAPRARKRVIPMFEIQEDQTPTRHELDQGGELITVAHSSEQIVLTVSNAAASSQQVSYTIKVPLTKDACLALARDLLTTALTPLPTPLHEIVDELEQPYRDFVFTRR
jgi:5-methylcytosine-specific restriction endonuclease McrA